MSNTTPILNAIKTKDWSSATQQVTVALEQKVADRLMQERINVGKTLVKMQTTEGWNPFKRKDTRPGWDKKLQAWQDQDKTTEVRCHCGKQFKVDNMKDDEDISCPRCGSQDWERWTYIDESFAPKDIEESAQSKTMWRVIDARKKKEREDREDREKAKRAKAREHESSAAHHGGGNLGYGKNSQNESKTELHEDPITAALIGGALGVAAGPFIAKGVMKFADKWHWRQMKAKREKAKTAAAKGKVNEESLPHNDVQRIYDETNDIGETELLCGVKSLKVTSAGEVISYISEDTEKALPALRSAPNPHGGSEKWVWCPVCKGEQGKGTLDSCGLCYGDGKLPESEVRRVYYREDTQEDRIYRRTYGWDRKNRVVFSAPGRLSLDDVKEISPEVVKIDIRGSEWSGDEDHYGYINFSVYKYKRGGSEGPSRVDDYVKRLAHAGVPAEPSHSPYEDMLAVSVPEKYAKKAGKILFGESAKAPVFSKERDWRCRECGNQFVSADDDPECPKCADSRPYLMGYHQESLNTDMRAGALKSLLKEGK